MQVDEKFTARDMREGGFYWVQQELLYTFLPLIGRDAAWLYQALCQIIPLAENNSLDLSLRMIAKMSGYGKSVGQVHRCMATLTTIGMVVKKPRGRGLSDQLRLPSLRKLAALGTTELQRRLGVPVGNSAEDAPEYNPAENDGADTPDSPTASDDAGVYRQGDTDEVATPPAGSGEEGVPRWNTADGLPESGKKPPQNVVFKDEVFQKQGGSVPETGGYCSSEEAPLILNLNNLKLNYPPTPLASEGGMLGHITANADPKDNSKSKGLPDEGEDRAKTEAVAKVLRELGMVDSGRRGGMAAVVQTAMELEASKTDQTPNWNGIAESMITARSRYAAYGLEGLLARTYGPKNFYALGLWRNPGLWMIDEKKLEHRRNMRVGT